MLNVGGLLPKVISMPITSIQVSRIIIGTVTVWTLFSKYVSDPNFYMISLVYMRAVSTELCREVDNY